jgi:hypothetical protein
MQLENKTDLELSEISEEAFRAKQEASQILSMVGLERDRRKDVKLAELILKLEAAQKEPK